MSLKVQTDSFNRFSVMQGMAKQGFQGDSLRESAAFLTEFTIPIASITQSIENVVLDAHPAAPLCSYDLRGTLRLNVVRMAQIVGTEHGYPLYIINTLNESNPNFILQIDWDAFHNYLSQCISISFLKDMHTIILLFSFNFRKHTKRELHGTCMFPSISAFSVPFFFARPGNVELRALRTILEHSEEIGPIAREIAANCESESFMYRPTDANDSDVKDLGSNIRMLITNAGMYGDAATLEESVRSWGKKYLDGLRNSSELFLSWEYSMHLQAVKLLSDKSGMPFDRKPPLNFGSMENFYQHLSGRRVLFITPFATAVEEVIRNGRLKLIWKDITPPDFDIFTISAFVSTYPNTPHRSWLETYDRMTKMIDEVVAREDINIVVASCGCYGIPLMNHAVTRHGVSAIYYGNMMNMFFGVKQNAFTAFYKRANLEHWSDPYLGWDAKPVNIERIDDGKYVSTRS